VSKSKWTETEVDFLVDQWQAGETIRNIAKQMKRTPRSIERKASNLNLDPRRPEPKQPVDPNEADYWKQQYKRVSKMLEDERWKKTEVEALVEEVYTIAPRSYQTAGAVTFPKKNKGKAQSAVLLLSDTHIGQVVEADQTLDMGEYNFEIFLSRLKRLEEAVFSILHDHVNTKVDELVIPILGDMIHGNLAHAVEAGQKNTLFTQFYAAGHALAQFLRHVATLVPKVRIFTTVGNHPRWGTQRKMPTDNRYSNLDQFLYAYTEALTKDIKNIEWRLDKQPFALFGVQGYHFYCGHGDNLRGGDKSLGIPAHSIGRKLASTMGLNAKAGRPLVNYYCFGHLHKPIQIPHTLGEVIVNGGFPGVDGFGLAEGFQSYWPSQKFFLVHPKFGRAACYDLRLDFAPDGDKPYYEIPETGII
jgi:hypothetical protein